MNTSLRNPLGLVVLFALLCLAMCAANAQTVVVNGVKLATSHPPVNVSGNLMLPMRDVFEALQADVQWFPAQKRIVAVRGRTTVELRLGVALARINGKPMKLVVAPRLVRDVTYVPLRFPAEAFGATLQWQAATRTALITIAPPEKPVAELPPSPAPEQPESATPATPTVPTPSPAAQPTTVEGTLVQVILAPSSMVVALTGSGHAEALTLGPGTTITRHLDGQDAAPAQLAEAMPGDLAVAVIGGDGVAQRVDLSYGEADGTLAGVANNSLLLKDNSVFNLSPNVAVRDQAGRQIALWDVPADAPVRLRYQPKSRDVYEVRLRVRPPAPAVPTTKPSIMLIGLLNSGTIFRAGDALKVQLQGTAGGAATASLGEVFRDLPLREIEDGVYEGEYAIGADTNERDLSLVGHLLVNGMQAPVAGTSTRVTIDSAPPDIDDVAPFPNTVASGADVLIEAAFDPGKGAPINPDSAVLTINGARIRGANVTAERLGYQAQDLASGTVRVRVAVEDMAGNRATRSWTFTVKNGVRPVFDVAHDARGTLTAGTTLRVSMRARKPGGIATFDVGSVGRGVPMPRVGASDSYRGEYVVQPGDRVSRGLVTVHYQDPDGIETSVDLGTRVSVDASR